MTTTTPTRPISPKEYLSDVHKDWDGDWEGDFDYPEGILQRHDWGDYAHALMHSQLLAALTKMGFGSKIYVMPSLTIQITPTRFRVPDIAIFDSPVRNEKPVVSTPPWVVIEILSPEDTFMNLDELVADYRCMGIANIRIVDARQSSAWNCAPAGWLPTDTITVPGTTVSLNLADLVAADA